uniref:Uncharacterized protein n=1 Tax=Rhizophora mucronata TaxID=61149 RepID=A0A2P2R3X6_RHIMU
MASLRSFFVFASVLAWSCWEFGDRTSIRCRSPGNVAEARKVPSFI